MKKQNEVLLLVVGASMVLGIVSSGKVVRMEERFEEKSVSGVTHTIVKILSIPAAMGAAALAWFAAKPSPSPYGQPQIWSPQWGDNQL